MRRGSSAAACNPTSPPPPAPHTHLTGTPSTDSFHRYYGYDGSQVCVEDLVLQHFAREQEGRWSGIHSEGGVWATLFGLCFWDVMFSGECALG